MGSSQNPSEDLGLPEVEINVLCKRLYYRRSQVKRNIAAECWPAACTYCEYLR
jgi:hypothetical protein